MNERGNPLLTLRQALKQIRADIGEMPDYLPYPSRYDYQGGTLLVTNASATGPGGSPEWSLGLYEITDERTGRVYPVDP